MEASNSSNAWRRLTWGNGATRKVQKPSCILKWFFLNGILGSCSLLLTDVWSLGLGLKLPYQNSSLRASQNNELMFISQDFIRILVFKMVQVFSDTVIEGSYLLAGLLFFRLRCSFS